MFPETSFSSRHFRLHRLADGVFAAIARVESGGEVANAGIVDLGSSVLIFDTFLLPQAARDLRRAAWQLTGRSAVYVINSHYHLDHVLGNSVFAPEATIISTVGTRDLLLTRGADMLDTWQTEGRSRLEAERRRHDALTDPAAREVAARNLTLLSSLLSVVHQVSLQPATLTSDARLTLHGRNRTVEFLSYGGGHSPSDGFLFLPADGILFAGDLLAVKTHPGMSDAHPDRWPAILRRMATLDFATIVPGHGPLAGREAIEEMLAYFETLTALVANQVMVADQADVPADDVPQDDEAADPMPPDAPEPLAGIEAPAPFREWEGSAFPGNLRRLYRHLTSAQRPETA